MELEESFLTQLVHRFLRNGFIKAIGRGLWAVTQTGGSFIHYAIAVAFELGQMAWDDLRERIDNSSRERNGMVSIILNLLSTFGVNSFESVVRLVAKAFQFLMSLVSMVGNQVGSSSSKMSISQR